MRTYLLAFLLIVIPAAYEKGSATKTAKDAGTTLRIVKDELSQRGNFYLVKGSIYNPNASAVKNVVIRYYVWKKFMGHDDVNRGSIVKQTGGLCEAKIKYLPPKQTVEFATDANAQIYNDVTPDPLEASISAEWDQ
jgi:hypothetical protein